MKLPNELSEVVRPKLERAVLPLNFDIVLRGMYLPKLNQTLEGAVPPA